MSRTYQSIFIHSHSLRLAVAGSASGASHFRGHLCVRFCCGLVTRDQPKVILSIDSKASVSLGFAIQATGLLTITLTGLTPVERVILSGRYNHTCGSPACGSPVGGLTSLRTQALGGRLQLRRKAPAFESRNLASVDGLYLCLAPLFPLFVSGWT